MRRNSELSLTKEKMRENKLRRFGHIIWRDYAESARHVLKTNMNMNVQEGKRRK